MQLISAETWYVRLWLPDKPFFELRRLVAFCVDSESCRDLDVCAIDGEGRAFSSRDQDFGGYFPADQVTPAFRLASFRLGKPDGPEAGREL